ncbi:MAG: hypothetical protein ABI354_02405 [Candidatus Saccharimonadales bacterium]
MNKQVTKHKFKEWLHRYLIAELLGTLLALGFAYISFVHTHSYIIAAAAGLLGEGIGFYGYFITAELVVNGKAYRSMPLLKRLSSIIYRSSTNLLVEFAPAEVIDTIFVRPFLMYYAPQHLKPYALGFIVGKFAADGIFYIFAISGYELKRRIRAK